MTRLKMLLLPGVVCALFRLGVAGAWAEQALDMWAEGSWRGSIHVTSDGGLRTYELIAYGESRDNNPPEKQITILESPDHATIRTGDLLFDGLYALAVQEALQNSVSQIKDNAYNQGEPIPIKAFQTGELWTYVWTRDLSYSTHLALAGFDPPRAVNSLLFKASVLKPSVTGGFDHQIVQDTGSGGSYPVSSDRVVWALGASEALKFLPEGDKFLAQAYDYLNGTIEQDRRLIFDPRDGLYRGEQSFLDWREQTYPGWTKDNVLAIAMSKALSVNVADYFALLTAADCAGRLGHPEEQSRYAGWAGDLKRAINGHFYDADAGLYSTYLLTDAEPGVRVHRYDLLGESLAVLLGVADAQQAASIIRHYPVGPFGPPVVWPEERTVPIYHNYCIWPFVTAYWVKAARVAGNAEAVNEGIRSLMREAALNLSNMENEDFGTGKTQATSGSLKGPVVDSRRQIWSVAGYLAMVQDVVFGLETSYEGIRFRPFITSELRRERFAASDEIELREFSYRGKKINVTVHLPSAKGASQGAYRAEKIELNGKQIDDGFVMASALEPENKWEVYLTAGEGGAGGGLREIKNVTDERAVFGPIQPTWENVGQGGLTMEAGRVTLHYRQQKAAEVAFNIYRDGRLCAKKIRETQWTDAESSGDTNMIHAYAVEAVDARTGNTSHLTPTRFYVGENQEWTIPARAMTNHGGQLADGGYFMNWGKRDDELVVTNFTAARTGRYWVRTKFSNGCGPVNTGITCAVKKLEIRKSGTDAPVAEGYLIMPQSGDWNRYDPSSIVTADLTEGESYTIRIFEDDYSRNMSYLRQNEHYTALPGGGDSVCNFLNISAIELICVGK